MGGLRGLHNHPRMGKGKSMIRFLCLLFVVLVGAVLAVLMFMRCAPVDDWGDSGTPDDCPAACDNLDRLECDGADGSPGPDEEFGTADDRPCEAVCRGVMGEGVTMHPACVADAESCDAVEECFNRTSVV